jgi:hypothetical protein
VPAALRRVCPPLGIRHHRASHDDYEDSYLPSGMTAGSAEEALEYTDELTRGTTSLRRPLSTPTGLTSVGPHDKQRGDHDKQSDYST